MTHAFDSAAHKVADTLAEFSDTLTGGHSPPGAGHGLPPPQTQLRRRRTSKGDLETTPRSVEEIMADATQRPAAAPPQPPAVVLRGQQPPPPPPSAPAVPTTPTPVAAAPSKPKVSFLESSFETQRSWVLSQEADNVEHTVHAAATHMPRVHVASTESVSIDEARP